MSLHQFEDGVYSSRTVGPVLSAPPGRVSVPALLKEWRAAIKAECGEDSDYPYDEQLIAVCGAMPAGELYLSPCEWFSRWLVTHKGWTEVNTARRSIGDYTTDAYGCEA